MIVQAVQVWAAAGGARTASTKMVASAKVAKPEENLEQHWSPLAGFQCQLRKPQSAKHRGCTRATHLEREAPHQKPNCSMASLPVASSAAKMPMTQIMAKRPLLISLVRISSLYILTPKGSPKLPGSLPSSSLQASSKNAVAKKSTVKPRTPSPVPMAPKPAGVLSKPGSLTKCWPSRPTEAIMATRPCFSSEARNLLKPSSSPTIVKPSGSKKPSGAMAPICSLGWNGGGGGGTSASATAAPLALRGARS